MSETKPSDRQRGASALEVARGALAGGRAWVVGGAVRDRLLGRATTDLDVVVAGDPEAAARAVARAARAARFPLHEQFGSWRVAARDGAWQLDLEPLRGETIEDDLALRDFTVNAIAEPLAGGGAIDPLGGIGDLRERRLRMAGEGAFGADPLRVLRLARMVVELDLRADSDTVRAAALQAGELRRVSAERVFAELRRILGAPAPRRGLETMAELGATAVVLPELDALRGVEQSRYHHLDVYEHTLTVLDGAVALTTPDTDRARPLAEEARASLTEETRALLTGEARASLTEEARALLTEEARALLTEETRALLTEETRALLGEPLADQLTRGQALRWGALLHDVAKPVTRAVAADGRVTFLGHDARGAEMTRALLGRLRTSERLRAHVSGLVRHHLRLGFLVHEPQPLSRRAVYRYLRACAPVEVDVTLLSVADRLATRGAGAAESIARHLTLARAMLGPALAWRAQGPPPPLVRGDELARELGIAPGPRLGQLLEQLAEDRYAGELSSRAEAVARARELLASD